MTEKEFKELWKRRSMGLSPTEKRKLKAKHYNHYSWSAFTFGQKRRSKSERHFVSTKIIFRRTSDMRDPLDELARGQHRVVCAPIQYTSHYNLLLDVALMGW